MCRNSVIEVIAYLEINDHFITKKYVCILASKWSVVGGRICIIFYRAQETFWSLNRDSSLLGDEVIGKIAFFTFLGHKPELRGHRLTNDLDFACIGFVS